MSIAPWNARWTHQRGLRGTTDEPRTTMIATEAAPQNDTWTAQLEQLRVRYRHASPAILAALNILVHNQNITVDDAKAQAERHGARITTASMKAAHVLLSRMDTLALATAPTTPAASAKPKHPPRRQRATDAAVDAESLIKGVVAKLQNQTGAEADRVRDGIRRAITILQALVG